jgi:hypothetical protein
MNELEQHSSSYALAIRRGRCRPGRLRNSPAFDRAQDLRDLASLEAERAKLRHREALERVGMRPIILL